MLHNNYRGHDVQVSMGESCMAAMYRVVCVCLPSIPVSSGVLVFFSWQTAR